MTDLVLPPGIGATAIEEADGPIRRFAELLSKYDPRFTLEYIPPGSVVDATVDEILKPYRIVETTPALGRQVVRYITADEMKRPDRLLAWVWEGDFTKHRPGEVWDRMQREGQARKMLDLKAREEEAQARIDYSAFLVGGGRDKKNRVQVGRNHYFNTGA